MKGVVLDASIAASWWLPDEMDPDAEAVLDQMQAGRQAFVPSLWLLETVNLLFNAERRKRIDRKGREDALEKVQLISVTILPPPLQSDVKTLQHFAQKHQLTGYDAEYLRVAKEQGLVLATFDKNLIAAAKRENVQVFSAA